MFSSMWQSPEKQIFFIALAFALFISIALWQIIAINFQFWILPSNKVLHIVCRKHCICLREITYSKKGNFIFQDDGILYEDK